MTTTFAAAQLAAARATGYPARQVPIAAQYKTWLDAKPDASAAISALDLASRTSRNPAKVLIQAQVNYDSFDDYTDPTGTAALSATYARPLGTIAVALGDSLTGNNGGPGPQSGTPTSVNSKGHIAWANVYLNHALTWYNAGKSGDTTAQMLARFDTDVTPYAPRIVFVGGGTNDMLQNAASTVTTGNLAAIYTKARALGALVVAMTVPPNTNATTAQANEGMKVNRWIRDQARSSLGIVVADIAAALLDPATTFKPLTGYTIDGTHPSAAAAPRMGRIIADAIRPFVPTSNSVLGQSNGDPTNLLANPMFNGTGTALPASWTVSGGLPAGATVSYVARSDGGSTPWLQFAVTNGTGAISFQQNVTVDGSALSVGDSVYFAVEFQCDTLDPAPAANSQALQAFMQCYNGSSFTSKVYDMYWDTTYINSPVANSSGVFVTPSMLIPSGTTLVQPVIQIRGGGNYRFGRSAIRKG